MRLMAVFYTSRAMAQAVTGRPCTAEDRVHIHLCPCDICSGHSALEQTSVRILPFLLSVWSIVIHTPTYPTGTVRCWQLSGSLKNTLKSKSSVA